MKESDYSMNNKGIKEHIEEKIVYAVNWLREQVSLAGAQGLVVGVSGGIDSAVVANLIKRAYPNKLARSYTAY